MSHVTLDNKIFCLQHTQGLTQELRNLVYQADLAFLKDRDSEALKMVTLIESLCKQRGIKIYKPDFSFS